MLKKGIIITFLSIITYQSIAQKVHTVKPGETLSGIAQKYGTSVSSLSKLNDMKSSDKLLIGAKIKLPTTTTSKTATSEKKQAPAKNTSSKTVAADKKNTNKKTTDSKSADNKKTINKKPGETKTADKKTTTNNTANKNTTDKKIVKTKTTDKKTSDKSTADKKNNTAKATSGTAARKVKTHTVKSGETLSGLAKRYGTTVGNIMRLNMMDTDSKLVTGKTIKIPDNSETVVKAPATAKKTSEKATSKSMSERRIAKETPVKEKPAKTSKIATTKAFDDQDLQEAKEEKYTPVETAAPAQNVFEPVVATAINESFYATNYRISGEETQTSGAAKVFKTQSGWDDQKYFILMNNIEPGRVVKIKNPQTEQTIYAKVLWNLGSAKENQGLTYRISDAAAKTLGINSDRFDLSVVYYK